MDDPSPSPISISETDAAAAAPRKRKREDDGSGDEENVQTRRKVEQGENVEDDERGVVVGEEVEDREAGEERKGEEVNEEEGEVQEVKEILDKRVKSKRKRGGKTTTTTEYLVSWAGSDEDQTWGPLENLTGCPELLAEFESKRSTLTQPTTKNQSSQQQTLARTRSSSRRASTRSSSSSRNSTPSSAHQIDEQKDSHIQSEGDDDDGDDEKMQDIQPNTTGRKRRISGTPDAKPNVKGNGRVITSRSRRKLSAEVVDDSDGGDTNTEAKDDKESVDANEGDGKKQPVRSSKTKQPQQKSTRRSARNPKKPTSSTGLKNDARSPSDSPASTTAPTRTSARTKTTPRTLSGTNAYSTFDDNDDAAFEEMLENGVDSSSGEEDAS
ncbi:hypothetical protein HK102_006769, partial [Quaeritorhiza haematococci]